MTESPKFEFKLLGSIKRLKISPCFCVHLRIYMNFNYKKSMHTDLIENNLYNYSYHLFILIYNKWTDPRPHSNFIIYLHRILSSDCQVEFGLNASQKSLSGFKSSGILWLPKTFLNSFDCGSFKKSLEFLPEWWLQ